MNGAVRGATGFWTTVRRLLRVARGRSRARSARQRELLGRRGATDWGGLGTFFFARRRRRTARGGCRVAARGDRELDGGARRARGEDARVAAVFRGHRSRGPRPAPAAGSSGRRGGSGGSAAAGVRARGAAGGPAASEGAGSAAPRPVSAIRPRGLRPAGQRMGRCERSAVARPGRDGAGVAGAAGLVRDAGVPGRGDRRRSAAPAAPDVGVAARTPG